MPINLTDFKKVVEAFRAEMENKAPKVKPSEEVKSECIQMLDALRITLPQFVTDCTLYANLMGDNPKAYHHRVENRFEVRLIATAGLEWNLKSQNRVRDFMMGAMAAKFEALIVSNYRAHLVANCAGAAVMRSEFHDYFMKIAKGNKVLASGDRTLTKPITTKREWFFADNIEASPGLVETSSYDPQDLETKLESSQKNFIARKDNRVLKMVDSLVKMPSLACMEEGVAPGTLETSAFHLITAIGRVRGLALWGSSH